MGKLTCGCLNVQIHAKKAAKPSLFQLGVNTETQDDFFNLDICEGLLDLEGIRIVQKCLVERRPSCGWMVHQCVNCEMITHAVPVTPESTSKILLNLSLKSDVKIIERLKQSPDFSKLYHIILASRNDNHPLKTGLQTGKYEILKDTLTTIQTSLNTFLVDAESAMEERIRTYEEDERSTYAELQSKARRDKNTMINLVLSMDDDSNKRQTQQTSFTSNQTPMVVTSISPESHLPSVISTPSALQTQKVTKLKPSVKGNISSALPHFMTEVDHDQESEAMFDLDGMHEEDDPRPFYVSDDENDTDDSGSMSEESYDSSVVPGNKSIYSASVPISVPAWRLKPTPSIDDAEDDFKLDRRHQMHEDDIAASMKALALSVHCDGTEMFGDRPRPRVNTMDIGNA